MNFGASIWVQAKSLLFTFKVIEGKKRFAISRARLGSGGEIYIGAKGLREDRYCSGDR